MTLDEAKKLWCPFVREEILPGKPFNGQPNCIASECMAWRWITENTPDGRGIQASKTEGYCGLAGKL